MKEKNTDSEYKCPHHKFSDSSYLLSYPPNEIPLSGVLKPGESSLT